jgi:hypothetical protein
MVECGERSSSSGKILAPGKVYFLRLAADAVREINSKRDKPGLTNARKGIMSRSLPRNVSGECHAKMQSEELQKLIFKAP